jgi:hypothetical protein
MVATPLSNADAQVEPREDPFVHSSFDWIASAAVRSSGQIHRRRSERKFEPVAARYIGRVLQHLPNDRFWSSPAETAIRCTVRPMSTV